MRTYRALWIIEPSRSPPGPFPPVWVEFTPLEFVTAGLGTAVLPAAGLVTWSAIDTKSQQVGTRTTDRILWKVIFTPQKKSRVRKDRKRSLSSTLLLWWQKVNPNPEVHIRLLLTSLSRGLNSPSVWLAGLEVLPANQSASSTPARVKVELNHYCRCVSDRNICLLLIHDGNIFLCFQRSWWRVESVLQTTCG